MIPDYSLPDKQKKWNPLRRRQDSGLKMAMGWELMICGILIQDAEIVTGTLQEAETKNMRVPFLIFYP